MSGSFGLQNTPPQSRDARQWRPVIQFRGMAKRPVKQSPDDILTSPTAARIAGLDRVHFARLLREGKGPRHQAIEAGKRHIVLILRRDLAAWMAARKG